jgi:hypothetical protein
LFEVYEDKKVLSLGNISEVFIAPPPRSRVAAEVSRTNMTLETFKSTTVVAAVFGVKWDFDKKNFVI